MRLYKVGDGQGATLSGAQNALRVPKPSALASLEVGDGAMSSLRRPAQVNIHVSLVGYANNPLYIAHSLPPPNLPRDVAEVRSERQTLVLSWGKTQDRPLPAANLVSPFTLFRWRPG